MQNDVLLHALMSWCKANGVMERKSDSIFSLLETLQTSFATETDLHNLNTLIKWELKKSGRSVRILDQQLQLNSRLQFSFSGNEVEVYGDTDPIQLYLNNEESQTDIKNFVKIGQLLSTIGFDFQQSNVDCHVIRLSGNETEHDMRLQVRALSPKLEELIISHGRNKIERVIQDLQKLDIPEADFEWTTEH